MQLTHLITNLNTIQVFKDPGDELRGGGGIRPALHNFKSPIANTMNLGGRIRPEVFSLKSSKDVAEAILKLSLNSHHLGSAKSSENPENLLCPKVENFRN